VKILNYTNPPPAISEDIGFVAIYSKMQAASIVDFESGELQDEYDVTFTHGVLYVGSQYRQMFKNTLTFDLNEMFAIIYGELTLQDKVVKDLVRYDVTEIIQTMGKWTIAKVKHTRDTAILTPVAVSFIANKFLSCRTVVAIDWLVRQLPVEPVGIIWPLVGSLKDSAEYLYPIGGRASLENRVGFKELGRKAGYSLVDGSIELARDLNTNLTYKEVINTFNLIMGRM